MNKNILEALYATIRTDSYKLADILQRIELFYAKGEISETDRENLIFAARQHAADALEIDVKAEIKAICLRLRDIETKIEEIEKKISPDPEPEPEPEIPEYVQPTGAHDAYNIGDKVRYKSKIYECLINACVWAPDVYPAAWKEIVPNGDQTEE